MAAGFFCLIEEVGKVMIEELKVMVCRAKLKRLRLIGLCLAGLAFFICFLFQFSWARISFLSVVQSLTGKALRQPQLWDCRLMNLSYLACVCSFAVWIGIFFNFSSLASHKVDRICACLLLFLVSFLVTYFFSNYDFDAQHNGSIFFTARFLSKGAVMYRDVGGQYGVLFYYIMAAFIKLFGEYLWAINMATSCVYAVCYCLLFLCSCQFMSGWRSFVIVLLTLAMAPFYICLFQPWSSVFALMFLLLANYLLFRYIRQGYGILLVLCSLSTIACFLCRQPVGIVLFLSFVLFFVFAAPLGVYVPHYKKSILCYFSVFIAVGGGIIAYLVSKGTFMEFLRQNFIETYKFAKNRTDASNPLSSILNCLFVHTYLLQSKEKTFITWRLLPLSSIAVFVFVAIKKLLAKGTKEAVEKESLISMLFAQSIICIASWHQYYPVTCVRHVFWAAFPMPMLLFYGLLAVSLRICKKAWPAWLLFILILSPVVLSRMEGGIKKAMASYVYADSTNFAFMEKIRLNEDQKAYYDAVSAAVAEARNTYGAHLKVDTHSYGGLYFYSYNDELLRGGDDIIALIDDAAVVETYKAMGYSVIREIPDNRYSKDSGFVTYVLVKS